MQRNAKWRRVGIIAIAAMAATGTRSVSAQSATPATLDAVTLPPAAAKRALNKMEINAQTAERLVNACVEYSRAHNGGASVVVISPAGYLVHAHRTDGQQPNNIDSALRKAQTALYLRVVNQRSAESLEHTRSTAGPIGHASLSQSRRLPHYCERPADWRAWRRWRRPAAMSSAAMMR